LFACRHDVRPSYVGAYHDDGLNHPVITSVVEELREAMPHVIGELPLVMLWAYKLTPSHSSTSSRSGDETMTQNEGLKLHADDARVNVNLWLTADEANIDSAFSASSGGSGGDMASSSDRMDSGTRRAGGGLVIYKRRPPSRDVQPDFANNWKNEAAILQYLQGNDSATPSERHGHNEDAAKDSRGREGGGAGGKAGGGTGGEAGGGTESIGAIDGMLSTRTHTTVHYRQNRLVLFDSSLFHCTDKVHFRGGYKHSRINLTFLFGLRRRV
jgi:hypothetical protein